MQAIHRVAHLAIDSCSNSVWYTDGGLMTPCRSGRYATSAVDGQPMQANTHVHGQEDLWELRSTVVCTRHAALHGPLENRMLILHANKHSACTCAACVLHACNFPVDQKPTRWLPLAETGHDTVGAVSLAPT